MANAIERFPTGSILLWTVLGLLVIIPVGSFLLTAVSPRALHLGSSWWTLSNVEVALSGYTGRAIVNSLWVSTVVGVAAVSAATALAWLVQRTNIVGAKVFSGSLWVLLLVPTWITTMGWINTVLPGELLSSWGIDTTGFAHQFFGPLGVCFILFTAALPFAYLIVSAGLRGLGSEFEDAARVHGAGRLRALSMVLPILAPTLVSAFAIAFAETISDFGVAFTLNQGNHIPFPLATFTLFGAIYQQPSNFPVAAVLAGVLIVSTVVPVLVQAKMTKGRSYATLSARSRPVRIYQFSPFIRVAVSVVVAAVLLVVVGLPLVGIVSVSFTQTVSFFTTTGVHWTTASYHAVFHPRPGYGISLAGPFWTSDQLGVVVATGAAILALVLARRMVKPQRAWARTATDVVLLGSIAIPGIVLGVGYILFFNQRFITAHLIDLYETTPLLALALIASAIPGQTRLLLGPVGQLHSSMAEAARVHGAGRIRTWWTTSFPLLSRTLVWAWVLTFTKTIAELAIAQILYQPGHEPASVAIEALLAGIAAPVGAAATVLLLGEMLLVIGVVLLAYRLVAPKGWRRIGTTPQGGNR